MPDQAVPKYCNHCGATGTVRLGHCKVCHLAVCERCGNSQYAHGVREFVHNECLQKTGDSFSMIKFVE